MNRLISIGLQLLTSRRLRSLGTKYQIFTTEELAVEEHVAIHLE